jgi:hypothetical protein
LEAFGKDLTSEQAQAFIRNEGNLQKFNQFFKGEGSGRLFVYYQPELPSGEVTFNEKINFSIFYLELVGNKWS